MIFNSLGVNTSTRIINNIENSEVYSEEERVVGTWIDGKPIYRKTFLGLTLTGTRNQHILDVLSLNIDTMTDMVSLTMSGSDTIYNNYYDNGFYISYIYHADSNSIIAYSSTGASGRNVTFILEYTKTTDDPVEANTYFGDVHSLEETRVGTWIDGKPLYRKTAVLNVPKGDKPAISIEIGNIETVTLLTGAGLTQTGGRIPFPYQLPDVNDGFGYFCAVNETSLTVNFRRGANNANYTMTVYLTVEYTKTTDEALVSTTALMDSYDEGVNEA